MCAKPPPIDVYRPLAELTNELVTRENPITPHLAWAGITVFRGLLENA